MRHFKKQKNSKIVSTDGPHENVLLPQAQLWLSTYLISGSIFWNPKATTQKFWLRLYGQS